ncbi:MAG: hypothetical protein NZ554_14435, partial [Bryobacteraceae bacterium]|nr:hypothetical protein [Bryobacteraceae bacterium]
MLAALLFVAATGWVPARWTNPDPHSLELLDGTPINCLLMERVTAEFVRAAEARGVAVLRVLDASANTEAAFQEIVVAKPS